MQLIKSILILLLLTLAIVEVELRIFNPQPTFRWFEYDQDGNRWNKGRNDYYFLLNPAQKGFLTFNARRERSDKEFPLEADKSKRRVLLLGSSLTLGWPRNNGVAERLTDQASQEGKDIEVINCSMGNSNLATMLKTYVQRCSGYQAVDTVIIAVPLIATVDYLAAHSFLWGENFIDDPNKLRYLTKKKDLSEISLRKDEMGTPYFELNPEDTTEMIRYFNKPEFFYDHFHLVRLLMNRYTSATLFDETFLKRYKQFFDQSFENFPELTTTYHIIDRFKKLVGPKTHLIFVLIPTYHSMLLDSASRDALLAKVRGTPIFETAMMSPDSFAQKRAGGLEPFLNTYAERVQNFKDHFSKDDMKVIDISEEFRQGDPRRYFIEDFYHLSESGTEVVAKAILNALLRTVWQPSED